MFFVIYVIKSIKSKNQKHPPKTHIQEFPKTTSPTFGPSVCRVLAIHAATA